MKLPKPSEGATWIVLGALLLLARKRTRKPRGPGAHSEPPPGGHKIPGALSFQQLRELASALEVADPDTAAAIALAESGGRPKAVGDKGTSIGLWQINVYTCPKRFADVGSLKNAGFNAEAMSVMSNGGTNWEPWSTFRSGAYRKHLPKGQ